MKTASMTFAKIVSGIHHGVDREISAYCIDSSKASPNSAFFALKGSRTDGHKYIDSAIANGAKMIVIDKAHEEIADTHSNDAVSFVVVKDTLKALQDFALFVRVKSKATIVGITGSCGKTTTKEMIASVLSTMGKTVKTPGNYNSEYGLPLSLLLLDEDTEYGVFELGTDHPGMMEKSASIAGAEYAVITNIGISHLANYSSRSAIAEEKSNIFLPYTKAFVPAQSEFIDIFRRKANSLTVFDSVIEEWKDLGFRGYSFKFDGEWGMLPLLGIHNLKNASTAIAVLKAMGAKKENIFSGFASLEPIFGRNRVIEREGVTVIEDCYNAASDSMLSALMTLSGLEWKKGRKLAVLGDMCELGFKSEEAHEEIGKALLKTDCDAIYLFGAQMAATFEILKKSGEKRPVFHSRDFNALCEAIRTSVFAGDLLLLKGSRVMSMEKIYPALRKTS
jgi:UDP-N-acetylmuramoyl-tripeptide--D-alanyl-D-alanine ligase